MARGKPVPLVIKPGVKKTDSREAAAGRFTKAEWVRFVNGLPEKIGGWEKRSANQFTGQCRGFRCWNTNYGSDRYAFGTNERFYVADDGVDFVDRTPAVTTDYLEDAFSVTSLGTTITVAHASHGLSTGNKILFRGAKHSAGGMLSNLDLDGIWSVTVSDANTYTITHGTAADASVSSGGGKVLYVLPTANPFDVTSGSATVTVNKNSHGLVAGQLVEISGASAVGGITPDGTYEVLTASLNTFTIAHSAAASSTVSGGGGSVIIEGLLVEGRVISGGESAVTYFGEGTFGSGPFGAIDASALDASYIEPRIWSIDVYGEDLVFCPLGGRIYYYDTSRPGRPTPILEAPSSVRALFVTTEGIVHALGIDGNPLKFGWSDQRNLAVWSAADGNLASASRYVTEGSRLLGGTNLGGGLSLLWTDTACYLHQFTGGDLVYDTRLAPGGADAGLIGPLAFAKAGRTGSCYWLSVNGFRAFDGAVTGVPNQEDVEDWILEALDPVNKILTTAMVNPKYNEIWWTYPARAGSEKYDDIVTGRRYVMIGLNGFTWGEGELDRVGGDFFDRSGATPVWIGNDGYVYTHETGLDDGLLPIRATLKYAHIGSGAAEVSIDYFDPDFQRAVGDIVFRFSAYDTEPGTETDSDTLTYELGDGALQPRISGRFISVEIESESAGGDFRLGVPKVEMNTYRGRRWG